MWHPHPQPPHIRRARDAIALEMKDSWSNGDDRRDRGRDNVDRGVPQRSTRSRSPREDRSRPRRESRTRDRSRERRRREIRSPLPASREEVREQNNRERNRGRELLLDTQGSDKRRGSTQHSVSSNKRRKSRSPSPSRIHHKKSRRDSRSPSRPEGSSSRAERKRRAASPRSHRRRSPARDRNDRDRSPTRAENSRRYPRETETFDRRGRSPDQQREKSEKPRPISLEKESASTRRRRSPLPSPTQAFRERRRSPLETSKERDTRRNRPQSPDFDRYEPSSSSRQASPGAPKGPKGGLKGPRGGPKGGRAQSPRRDKGGRHDRDEYRPSSNKPKSKSGRPSSAASGANSIEVKSDKMANRGFYGGQQGYNPNQQMQAAFPLKPQYNQTPQPDPRQYSQSPHHMTPNSYHGSPQSQSPYSAGRGGFSQQQQYSPHSQYPQQQQQQQQQNNYPNGPQGQYYNNSQSPTYQAPTGPMNAQQNFRGNQRAFRGNNHFNARGGRGDRGGRGGHFQNTHWNSSGGPGGAGRGQYPHSGNVTPQHMSPQQAYPPQTSSHENTPSQPAPPEEDSEDLFRPSKELQVEDTSTEKKDEEKMPPPPARAPPTGPQSQNSSKFSFAFKGAAKVAPPLPQKPEISQKLNAVPVKSPVPDRPRGPAGPATNRAIPTEPASARSRHEFREPQLPLKRKVKKIERRLKPKPQLLPEFKASDSVYYRKPGNESVVGSGTYGKVFKAVHVYTSNLVALKKIRMEGEKDGFPVTAVREIKLLQSLKHVNIVNLQEVMVEKNDCFMVFEYLSHDLTGLLNHPTFKLEPAHKKHLAKQLFEGLDYLHRRGVLHRDIKAANILVSNEGQLKLADFGLARFYAKRRQLDYTNRVVTIWYRSPELCLGETQYGPAVDIWSAACVLVEIFTRHAIFPGDGGEISQLEKIYAILGTPNKVDWPGLVDMAWFELLRPSAKRANVFAEKYKQRVTPEAFDLLQAMFQYDPAKRPSAEAVLEHPYFTTEEPKPKQAVELKALEGDWHEFESKALRKENERREKEARRTAQKEKEKEKEKSEKEKKRGPEGEAAEREAKRLQMGPPSVPAKLTGDSPVRTR